MCSLQVMGTLSILDGWQRMHSNHQHITTEPTKPHPHGTSHPVVCPQLALVGISTTVSLLT